jgi:hypothetical protein
MTSYSSSSLYSFTPINYNSHSLPNTSTPSICSYTYTSITPVIHNPLSSNTLVSLPPYNASSSTTPTHPSHANSTISIANDNSYPRTYTSSYNSTITSSYIITIIISLKHVSINNTYYPENSIHLVILNTTSNGSKIPK